MARRPRDDGPGSLHHVFDRGVAHRSVFDGRADARYFLSRLARAVRQDLIRVHAYSLKGNHYHLLLESPGGQLGRAMHMVKDRYVRRFNQLHGRDGPLFRSRFSSRRVTSDAYLIVLLRYIDLNAATDGVSPFRYPFGSAMHYQKDSGPPWLTRSLVERIVAGGARGKSYRPDDYRRFLEVPLSEHEQELVTDRMRRDEMSDDPLDDLLTGGIGHVTDWLARRAAAADGEQEPLMLVPRSAVVQVFGALRMTERVHPLQATFPRRSVWDSTITGLLRTFCGLSNQEVARQENVSAPVASDRFWFHMQQVQRDPSYRQFVAELVSLALRATYGAGGSGGK